MKVKNKKSTRDRYALGSWVSDNSSIVSDINSQITNMPRPGGGNTGRGIVGGLSTGSSLGAGIGTGIASLGAGAAAGAAAGSVVPILGTAIGGLIGGAIGLFTGKSRDRREREEYNKQIGLLNEQRSNSTKDLYESSIDINNENPYGIYANGGDILNPKINIEKGELQIDPKTGKILREYKGINPETGGMYEKHAKGNKKDTENNMVTAEEGTFIITKKEAKKYKDAVDNNDKLYQNSIMSNIRNHKKSTSNKYQDGAGVRLSNNNFTIPNTLGPSTVIPAASQNIYGNSQNFNLWNALSTGLNYIPAIYNMFQGSRPANTVPYSSVRMNVGNRQRILSNLPQDVSVNPALNNIRNARRRSYRNIDANTANPSIARANKLSLEGQFLGAENEAYYNNRLMNNQIRGQRAGILSGLDAQDQARGAQNIGLLNNTFLQNRQMQLAKQQQFDYGLSQAQQMYQNNIANRQKRGMEERELEIMRQIFPVLSQYYPQLTTGR